MVSRMDAVASSYVRSQRAMSTATTSTCPDEATVEAATPRIGGALGPTDRSPVQVHSSTVATRAARAGWTHKPRALRRLGDIEASVGWGGEGHGAGGAGAVRRGLRPNPQRHRRMWSGSTGVPRGLWGPLPTLGGGLIPVGAGRPKAAYGGPAG